MFTQLDSRGRRELIDGVFFSLAAFASLRLGENRRPNEEAHFSQRRKGAKAPPFISQRPSVYPS
jgi:hypothetical protein